ncbi:cupin domain-containing protein [Proteiniclasticum sp. C24MP]|uniref:cupin domain-containing protein n=1 Tax=Proteiniclasticum sp. C24MP TaxID=3374101 RepID=UPI003754BD65
MRTKEEWIRDLHLIPHPEGGYYRQTDRSEEVFGEKRLPLYTNIYFLLTKESPSHFHRLTSDELWFYHGGSPLTIHSIKPDGAYVKNVLGLSEGQLLHHTVPAGEIFGSTVEEGFALVSCTVVPGFDFSDFRLFTEEELLKEYPQHEEIIRLLTIKKK